jgi:hypothetical protein
MCCISLLADTRDLLNKPLIIFNMNGVLLHAIHKISLQNKSLPRNLDIHTSTKIYFIYPGVREFFEQCFSIFEVGLWTSVQHKNVNEFFHFYLRTRLKRGQFKVILTQR